MDLTIVIPAYNEEQRLPATIAEAYAYLETLPIDWELIIANDGSLDRTGIIADQCAQEFPRVRHLCLAHGGKATAVRAGVLAARGETVIFTDADLATPIEYVSETHSLLNDGWDVVIGSREGVGSQRVGEPVHRHVMGRLYNYVVQAVLLPGLRDTQCGFKGFRREVALDLFTSTALYPEQSRKRTGPLVTAFDVELLYLARKRDYRIRELPVVWRHVAGSKVRPGVDGVLMLRDVVQVRLNAWRGKYAKPPAGERQVEHSKEH